MGDELPDFVELMMDAHRAAMALDDVMKGDRPKAMAAAVNNGKHIFSRLLVYQQTAWMTAAENATVQTALDLLRARLRFLGEAV
jgi:hypothetical protein